MIAHATAARHYLFQKHWFGVDTEPANARS